MWEAYGYLENSLTMQVPRPNSHKLCYMRFGVRLRIALVNSTPGNLDNGSQKTMLRETIPHVQCCSFFSYITQISQSSNSMFQLLVIQYIFIYTTFVFQPGEILRDQNLNPQTSLKQIYSDAFLLMGQRATAYLQFPLCSAILLSSSAQQFIFKPAD